MYSSIFKPFTDDNILMELKAISCSYNFIVLIDYNQQNEVSHKNSLLFSLKKEAESPAVPQYSHIIQLFDVALTIFMESEKYDR